MKIVIKDNNNYILRFDKGEELMQALSDFVVKEAISAASFTAIGTASEIELGFYNPHLKEYRKKPFLEELEIVSLLGNISLMDNKPSIHAHGSFSRTEFSMLGGHVFRLQVNATCEVNLTKMEGSIARKNNPDWNLNLLD
jgi:predicted DNA-binding protein with PD1-like motif